MEETGLAQRLLRVHNGERMLANYTHLVEVLHEAGRRHPTPAGLIAWFESAVAGADDEAGSEARKLRLESDANVVTGETIHSSKGLQYPVVYVPNGESFCEANKETAAVRRRHVDRSQSPSGMVLELEPTEDVLLSLGRIKRSGQLLVGFAAETDAVETYALDKLKRKNLDWIAANRVGVPGEGFESETNAVVLFSRRGEKIVLPLDSKEKIAGQILERILPDGRRQGDRL